MAPMTASARQIDRKATATGSAADTSAPKANTSTTNVRGARRSSLVRVEFRGKGAEVRFQRGLPGHADVHPRLTKAGHGFTDQVRGPATRFRHRARHAGRAGQEHRSPAVLAHE